MLIGDADSSHFCDVLFSDGEDAQVEPSRRHFQHRPSKQETEFFLRVLNAASLSEFNPDERLEIESKWLSTFLQFQDQFEVSHADERELQRLRSVLIDENEKPSDSPRVLEKGERFPKSKFAIRRVH